MFSAVPAWLLPRHSDFVPQSKDAHAAVPTESCMRTVTSACVNVSVNGGLSPL